MHGNDNEQDEGQDAHDNGKPVVHKPAHGIVSRVLLREFQGQVDEHENDMGNSHERSGQTESPAVRQEPVAARKETLQWPKRQRKGEAIGGGDGSAFFSGKQTKGFDPDVVIPDEEEEKDQVNRCSDYPLP